MRSISERQRSQHDHNVVPGTQTATNIRAHHERLPWASFRERQVLTMVGWDERTTVAARAAARARVEDYR